MGISLDEALKQMEYPGRFIVLSRDASGHQDIVLYGVTARSPPNQARRIVDEGSTVRVETTDPESMKGADPMLVLYDCIRIVNGNIVVSNGRQTNLVADTIRKSLDAGVQPTAVGALVKAFEIPYLVERQKKGEYIDLTKFEPDSPTNTSRISAVVTRNGAAMTIVRALGGQPVKSFFEVPLVNGSGQMIATYAGLNVPIGVPIPSWGGEPLDALLLNDTTPKELATHVYNLLGPKEPAQGIREPGKDFRVGVVAMFYDRRTDTVSTYVVNRHA